MTADTAARARESRHPKRIWATVNGMSTRLPDGGRQLIGGWSEDKDRPGAAEYALVAANGERRGSEADHVTFLRNWASDIRAYNGQSVDADRLDAIAAEIESLKAATKNDADRHSANEALRLTAKLAERIGVALTDGSVLREGSVLHTSEDDARNTKPGEGDSVGRTISAIEFSFIPKGMITHDDPLGERTFFAWKMRVDGKQYGKVLDLSAEPDAVLSPSRRRRLVVEALAEMDAIIQALDDLDAALRPAHVEQGLMGLTK